MSEPKTSKAERRSWREKFGSSPVFLGAFVGSLFGLVFGLGSLNRPLLNALVFYVLGALAGAGAGAAVLALRRLAPSPQRRGWSGSAQRRR